jgi:WD40 repeat protein
MDKSYIFLKSPIGSGGEANIYTVRIRPELVAKVYHQPHGDYARKLAFMVANPPVDPLAKEGRVSIAWATELVTDLGLVVGFLMPKLDTSKAKPIFQYYNPSERRKESPTFSYVSLLRTARNLARAVRSVHLRGYVIGDVNESNVLVAEDAIVTLVDTDSFQVNDGTTVYRCTVGKPEYTPPELQGVSFRDVDRSVQHDLFGLGVLIYQLLMEGTHPFGGVFRGQGEAPELKERIKAGHFPHGRRGVPYNPMPLAPSFRMLPVALQELFLLCFESGHGNPAARPTADVWSKALGEAEDGLVTCGVNGQHHYSGHLGVCPWCERAAKLGGRDPFPALGAISSGQHLKPAAIGNAVEKPILKAKATQSNSSKITSNYQITTNNNSISLLNKLTDWGLLLFSKPRWKYILICTLPIVLGIIIFAFIYRIDPITFLISQSKLQSNIVIHSGNIPTNNKDFYYNLSFSPDSKWLQFREENDTTIKIWDTNNGKLTHEDSLGSDFSPSGKLRASLVGNTIQLRNLSEGKLIYSLSGIDGKISAIEFSPDGNWLSAVYDYKTIALWDTNTGKLVHSISTDSNVYRLYFRPDSKQFIYIDNENTLKLCNILDSGNLIFDTVKVSGGVSRSELSYSPDGNWFAYAENGKIINLLNVNTRKTLQHPTSNDITALLYFTPDSKWLFFPSPDFENFSLWSIDTKDIFRYNNIKSFDHSKDGRWFSYISNENDKTIKLVDIQSGKTSEYYNYNLSRMWVFSDNSEYLLFIVNGKDQETIKLWNVNSGIIVDSGIKISPSSNKNMSQDNKLMVTVVDDRNIELWNVNTGRLVSKLMGDSNNILGLNFSPDGKLLASLNKDGTVKIWRVD